MYILSVWGIFLPARSRSVISENLFVFHYQQYVYSLFVFTDL